MNKNQTLKAFGSAAIIASSVLPRSMPVMAQEESNVVSSNEPRTVRQTSSVSKADALMNSLNKASMNEAKTQAALETAQKELEAAQAAVDTYQPVYDAALAERAQAEKAIDEKLEKEINEGTAALEEMVSAYEESAKEKESLEKELAEKQAVLAEEQSKLDEAEQHVVQTKAELDALDPAAVEESAKKVAEADSALAGAMNTLHELENAQAAAQTNYSNQAAILAGLQEKYDQAVVSSSVAEANLQQALAVQTEKEAILAQAQDEEVYAAAQQELTAAQNNVAQAQTLLEQTKQNIVGAEAELKNAQTAFDQAASELPTYEQAIAEAQKNVGSAEEQVKTAQDALDQAQAENGNKLEAQKKAETAVADAQAQLDKQEAAVESANKEVQNVQSKIDDLQAQINANNEHIKELQAQLDALNATYNLGSAGYFKSLADDGNEDALLAYLIVTATDSRLQDRDNSFVLTDSTSLGEKDDATNLENMKMAVDNLNLVNEYRQRENREEGTNLKDLKVSHSLMAIAQLDSNYSQDIIDHARAYTVGENVAWGRTNPFEGWYDVEKENFKTNNGEETGHYKNIVANYTSMGYAYTTGSKKYHIQYTQTFASPYIKYDQDAISVDEYKKSFYNYYNTLISEIDRVNQDLKEAQSSEANKALQASIEKAKTQLESQKQEVEKQQTLLSQKQEALQFTQTGLESATKELQAAQENIDNAEAKLAEQNEALSQAETVLKQKQDALENYLNSESVVNHRNALQRARTKLNSLQQDHVGYENQLVAYQALAQEKQNNLASLDAAIARAQHDLKQAQDHTASMSDEAKKAKDAVAGYEKDIDDQTELTTQAQTQLNSVSVRLAQVEDSLPALHETLNKAQAEYQVFDFVRINYEKALNDQKQAETTVSNLEESIPVLRRSLSDTSEKVAENNTKKETARSYLAEANRAKTIWNSLKSGQAASFKTEYPTLAMLPALFDQYTALKKNEDLAKTNLESLIADADTSVETLRQAKAEYDKARNDRMKAEKDLETYLAQFDEEKAVIVKTGDKKEEKKSASKSSNSVNTASETGLYVYAAGTVLTGSLAFAFLKRRKD